LTTRKGAWPAVLSLYFRTVFTYRSGILSVPFFCIKPLRIHGPADEK
jgi:hypothetical protein